MNSPLSTACLENLSFDNRFTRELPADPIEHNHRRQVIGACYSRVQPKQASQPRLIGYAREVGELIGISGDPWNCPEFTQVFVGNQVLSDMDPFAMCYGGHQFGNWAGQLGDGRAINLGEVVNPAGEHWMLQLKGAGPTPYSRTADGLAVLRSSLREFLCSEAMFHLGVPTTRALSLILTGDNVLRDMFYDGHPQYEPGAVVCRVAPSFTRFGNFQIFTSRGDTETLQKLVEYTIRHDFPQLGEPTPEVLAAWFAEVCRRTAEMMVHWMRVGFVHGVMNTDNMSILGLTIDYGPYGWLENYDPNWTPNTTDATGRRYRFGQQPQVALWNLVQLANTLVPLFGDDLQPLEQGLQLYSEHFETGFSQMAARKLGLPEDQPEISAPLWERLETLLQQAETDYTLFFRALSAISLSLEEGADHPATSTEFATEQARHQRWERLQQAFYQPDKLTAAQLTAWEEWLQKYREHLLQTGTSEAQRRTIMNRTNPKFVFRNYLAQLAIDQAEQGNYEMLAELHNVLRQPYDEHPEHEEWAAKRPEWARERAGCSMLSCSS